MSIDEWRIMDIAALVAVPAETGRHGGRPYGNTSRSFVLDLTGRFLAGGGAEH